MDPAFRTRFLQRAIISLSLLFVVNIFPREPVLATTFYVDNNHPNANDANPGTRKEHPLSSINSGVAKAYAGDVVLVFSGTYRESVYFPRSGKNTKKPIIIRAAPGSNVSLKGSDLVTKWTPHTGNIWKRTGWLVNSQQVFIDGIPLQQIGNTCPFNSLKWGKQYILPPIGRGLSDMTPGSFFYDGSAKTLYVLLPDGSDPNNHEIEASVRNSIINTDVSFIELHGLTFSHSNVSSIPFMMGIVTVLGKSWVISNCSFIYGDFAGLCISGEGHRIENNVASQNGIVGISINGSDPAHNWSPYKDRPPQNIELHGNETNYNNYRGFYFYFQGGGIYAANSCNTITISNHKAISNKGTGIWFDLDCRNVTIAKNILGKNNRGIEYEISELAIIANNLIIENVEEGIYISASDNVFVHNNTVVGNGFGIVLHGMPRLERPFLRNNAVRNNIIGESIGADLVVYHNDSKATGNSSDYNLFFQKNNKGVKISWTRQHGYKTNFTDIPSFAYSTGQDTHSLTGNPLWQNRLSGDYTIRAGSPAIGAGTREVNWPGDPKGGLGIREGKRFIYPHTDIGAYKYIKPNHPKRVNKRGKK